MLHSELSMFALLQLKISNPGIILDVVCVSLKRCEIWHLPMFSKSFAVCNFLLAFLFEKCID